MGLIDSMFSLCNLMSIVLQDLVNKILLVYADDIIMFAQTEGEALKKKKKIQIT